MSEPRATAVEYLILPGTYCDSVVLMELQRRLAERDGVREAAAVMATPANRELLAERGLLPSFSGDARPDDLLVVVRADSADAARSTLEGVGELLRAGVGGDGGAEHRARSLDTALRELPDARWVLVSVPGRWAAGVADAALAAGRNVFLYSDNVPLAEELRLKRTAGEQGLLVLGPDCGTAVVAGVGLGFANRVRRGGVGIVSASGTGLQAVASRIHALGGGLSHALGTGGRDLSREVGGATTLQALALLAADPATRVLVLVSKPPEPDVAARVLRAAWCSGKPVVAYFPGWPAPARRLGPLRFALSASDAAALALEALNPTGTETKQAGRARAESARGESILAGPTVSSAAAPDPSATAPDPSAAAEPITASGACLRGVFSGGTLALEALHAVRPLLGPIRSNLEAPLIGATGTAGPGAPAASEHTLLDLGADEFTVGRPHPMIDYALRLEHLAAAASDPGAGVALLDVVLGDGAHPDPAAELAPAVERARRTAASAGRLLDVAVVLVGTDEDPQGLQDQAERLRAAGARIFAGVDEAAAWVVGSLLARAGADGTAGRPAGADHRSRPAVIPDPAERRAAPFARAALDPPLAAINIGLEGFHASLLAQGAAAVHVDWRPPAGGDERLAGILARMKKGGS